LQKSGWVGGCCIQDEMEKKKKKKKKIKVSFFFLFCSSAFRDS